MSSRGLASFQRTTIERRRGSAQSDTRRSFRRGAEGWSTDIRTNIGGTNRLDQSAPPRYDRVMRRHSRPKGSPVEKRVFRGATQAEAEGIANDWLRDHPRVKQKDRMVVMGGPIAMREEDWIVTVFYDDGELS